MKTSSRSHVPDSAALRISSESISRTDLSLSSRFVSLQFLPLTTILYSAKNMSFPIEFFSTQNAAARYWGLDDRVFFNSSHQSSGSTNCCLPRSIGSLYPGYPLPLGTDEQGLHGNCCSRVCFLLFNNGYASNKRRHPGDLCWDSDLLCCLGDFLRYSAKRDELRVCSADNARVLIFGEFLWRMFD